MFHVPEKYRVKAAGRLSSDRRYGNNGLFVIKRPDRKRDIRTIAGAGGGWEHVSVTIIGVQRCPNWSEMCLVKRLFWDAEDTVIQYHPAKKDYINIHDYCLHLWRPIAGGFPIPPKDFI